MKGNGHDEYARTPEPHSGGHNPATIGNAVVIAEQSVKEVTFSTKLQWGAIGTVAVCFGILLSHVLDKMDLVTTANAQTAATATSAFEAGKINAARIEAVDAGTRQAIERLERKLDASEERTAKKLDDVQVTMKEVLREMRRK